MHNATRELVFPEVVGKINQHIPPTLTYQINFIDKSHLHCKYFADTEQYLNFLIQKGEG
jgi:hypothetical protein